MISKIVLFCFDTFAREDLLDVMKCREMKRERDDDLPGNEITSQSCCDIAQLRVAETLAFDTAGSDVTLTACAVHPGSSGLISIAYTMAGSLLFPLKAAQSSAASGRHSGIVTLHTQLGVSSNLQHLLPAAPNRRVDDVQLSERVFDMTVVGNNNAGVIVGSMPLECRLVLLDLELTSDKKRRIVFYELSGIVPLATTSVLLSTGDWRVVVTTLHDGILIFAAAPSQLQRTFTLVDSVPPATGFSPLAPMLRVRCARLGSLVEHDAPLCPSWSEVVIAGATMYEEQLLLLHPASQWHQQFGVRVSPMAVTTSQDGRIVLVGDGGGGLHVMRMFAAVGDIVTDRFAQRKDVLAYNFSNIAVAGSKKHKIVCAAVSGGKLLVLGQRGRANSKHWVQLRELSHPSLNDVLFVRVEESYVKSCVSVVALALGGFVFECLVQVPDRL